MKYDIPIPYERFIYFRDLLALEERGTKARPVSATFLSIHMDLDPRFPEVQGDPKDLETMFYYLLQNSLEAVNPDNPYIKISSKVKDPTSPFIEIEIFNTGTSPKPEEMGNLFVPFYSSKPYGTGFGLPIAQLAARKDLGELYLEALPDQGTKCLVKLPIPAEKTQSS